MATARSTHLAPTIPSSGRPNFYGAGLIIEQHPELGLVYGHSGTTSGHTAHAYHVVDADVTFAIIANGSQATFEDRSYRWFSPLGVDDILRLVIAPGGTTE